MVMRPRAIQGADGLRIICRCACAWSRGRHESRTPTPNLELPCCAFPPTVRMFYYTVDGGRVAGLPGPAYMEWDFARLRKMGYSVVVSLECDRQHVRDRRRRV